MLSKTILLTLAAAVSVSAFDIRVAPAPTAAPRFRAARDFNINPGQILSDAKSVVSNAGGAAKSLASQADAAVNSVASKITEPPLACATAVFGLDVTHPVPSPTGALSASVAAYQASIIADGGLDAIPTDANCYQTRLPENLHKDWKAYESQYVKWFADNVKDIQKVVDICPPYISNAIVPCVTGLKENNVAATVTGPKTTPTGAAPKATGMAAAVAIAAGFAGAAIFL